MINRAGDVASGDGLRFVVPVRSVHSSPNPKYFNLGRGVTWYDLLSDQGTGRNAITVPGTLRDSLVLLSVVLEQQAELHPTQITADTGAYSDVVFGLFKLLGFRFCPSLADIGGTQGPVTENSMCWHVLASGSTGSRRTGTMCNGRHEEPSISVLRTETDQHSFRDVRDQYSLGHQQEQRPPKLSAPYTSKQPTGKNHQMYGRAISNGRVQRMLVQS